MFRYAIAKFDLKTLGREPEGTAANTGLAVDAAQLPTAVARPEGVRLPGAAKSGEPATARGASYLAALGGAANILEVEACATRLRLSLVDTARLDEAALTQLGARGVLRLAKGTAQIIIGPLADQVAGEIQDAMRAL
jgi:PTS system N-acetylglucosamine-specific IIC component